MSAVDHDLDGRHAVVTGASRGIGAAIARALGARGARVSLLARDEHALNARVAALQADGVRAEAIVCDVTDDEAVERAFARAVQQLGAVQILVNNAGAAESMLAPATTRVLWDRMIAVNLTATFSCSAQVLPGMLAAGDGRIVNVASTAGLRGYKTMTAYCAAKHGVIGYTRALALETARHGVTVNAVCPGYTDTDMAAQAVEKLTELRGVTLGEARAMLTRIIPRGTLTSPDEVAAAVAWLCSPNSSAVTGIALPVAGGEI